MYHARNVVADPDRNVRLAILTWALASLAAIAALTLRPRGLMAWLEWPVWAQIVTSIVVLDFSIGYVSHRAMHLLPLMWRLHQIHHNDPFVDVTHSRDLSETNSNYGNILTSTIGSWARTHRQNAPSS